MKSFIISAKDENQRIDKYICKVLGKASKSFIYKMIRKKNIKLNDQKIEGNEILQKGDEIKFFFSDETFDLFKTESIHITNHKTDIMAPLNIVYEDEDLLVCNKPAGLLSQPDGKNENLVQQIEAYLYSEDNIFKPGICNRLDRNTSGIIVAGKNVKALQAMNQAIADRKVDKIYLTIVKGTIPEENQLKGYLLKNEKTNKVTISSKPIGDYIHTTYKPLDSNGHYTLLEVKILTGKSHQIRAHLTSIGHPVIGDVKYGDPGVNAFYAKKYGLKNQLLHAYKFQVLESSSTFEAWTKLVFVAPLPVQFQKIIADLFEAKI